MYTIPLCITCLLSPYCFLFAIVSEKFDSDVTWCGFLYLSCVWDSVCFLDLWVYSFNPSWKISGHSSFNYTFSRLLELFLSSLIPLFLVWFFCFDSFSSLYYIWIVSIFCSAIYDMLFIRFHVFFHLIHCSFHLYKFDLYLTCIIHVSP